jgi:hypothetical protein
MVISCNSDNSCRDTYVRTRSLQDCWVHCNNFEYRTPHIPVINKDA